MAKSKYDESLPERAGEYAAVHPLHPGFVTAWARAVARLVTDILLRFCIYLV